MTETCSLYKESEIQILRDYYNIPKHIPNTQVERYIEVLINTKKPRMMRIRITEDIHIIGVNYVKY